jgi:hypothetical protein
VAAVDEALASGDVEGVPPVHRLVNRRVARATARRYRRGTYVEIPASDRVVLQGTALPVTMARIDEWMAQDAMLDDS